MGMKPQAPCLSRAIPGAEEPNWISPGVAGERPTLRGEVLSGVLPPLTWDGGDVTELLVAFWCTFTLIELGVVLDPLLHPVSVEFGSLVAPTPPTRAQEGPPPSPSP